METDLISIIMSTYNESILELHKSIYSILNQTYKNIELIIINDNPNNKEVIEELYRIQTSDSRVKIFLNSENIGLVCSLNKALSHASGSYIARMDADDISTPQRLEKQLNVLKKGRFDLIGGNIELIDERDKVIGKLNFPEKGGKILFFMRWGSCLAHPTWLGKREVFDSLNGYRFIPYCEDYDFLLRALNNGYKLGNCREKCLNYRVREKSISRSYANEQYIIRNYLYQKRRDIIQVDEQNINSYMNSQAYKKEVRRYTYFLEIKEKIRTRNISVHDAVQLFLNKYTYQCIEEKIGLKLRGIC